MMKKVIYDFGANNGDDIPYYLLRSDVVVALEANPKLCEAIRSRFANEITNGRVKVENFVLARQSDQEGVPFYLHRNDNLLSQFPEPEPEELASFERVVLPAISAAELIAKHGQPHYVKIDLERYDGEVLKSLFENDIFPPYISGESHSPEVICLLIALGGYDAFKLVDGHTVSGVYQNCVLANTDGSSHSYSFPHHSAGPFGNDIHGEWLSGEEMLRKLALQGYGWKDIHASKPDTAPGNSFSLKTESRKAYRKRRYRKFAKFFGKAS